MNCKTSKRALNQRLQDGLIGPSVFFLIWWFVVGVW